MVVYIVASIALLCLGLLFDLRQHPNRIKIYMWLVFIVLVIISGGREYYVGIDTAVYVRFFENARFELSRFEKGFILFAKALRRVSANPSLLLFGSSIISIGGVCYFIGKNCINPVMSVALYVFLQFYFSQMNLMRQGMASSFIMLAYSALIHNKRLESLFLIFVAMAFHDVAIIALIPYVLWVYWYRGIQALTPKTTVLFAIMISVVSFMSYGTILNIVVRIVPGFSGYFSSQWSDSNYAASLMDTMVQFVFLLCGAYIFSIDGYKKQDHFMALMIICACIISTLSMKMEIWSRVAGLFSVYTAVLWGPTFISRIRTQRYRMIMTVSILLLSFAYMIIILVYRPQWSGVVPYGWRLR